MVPFCRTNILLKVENFVLGNSALGFQSRILIKTYQSPSQYRNLVLWWCKLNVKCSDFAVKWKWSMAENGVWPGSTQRAGELSAGARLSQISRIPNTIFKLDEALATQTSRSALLRLPCSKTFHRKLLYTQILQDSLEMEKPSL